MAEAARWQLEGDYFENCNCDFICPCLFSAARPLTATPTQGPCEVVLAFHIDRGTYGSVSLDGLNAVAAMRSPGAMGAGNMSVALYVDERGNPQQQEALQAIFSGQAGGPVAAFGPLISTVLGIKPVRITFTKEGKRRSAQIPNVLHLGVQGIPSMNPDGSEIWTTAGHPFNPGQLALATGEASSTFNDYGMRWDNSGKNGHYAPIRWSNG